MNRFNKEMHMHDEKIKHMNALYRKHEAVEYSTKETVHIYLIAVAVWTFIASATYYFVS